MEKNRLVLLLLGFLCCHLSGISAINISVNVEMEISSNAEKYELCVSDSAKVVYFAKLKEQNINFQVQDKGRYSFILTDDISVIADYIYSIDKDTTITLKPMTAVDLSEVVVTADAQPKTTATGYVFKLSDKAKKSGDPFRALSEIPLLNVDISGQSVKTNEGDTPMVLIDGKMVNSGIAPIDPKFIESVEITEVVNAKYLQMGVSKIIDIRLKREVPLFTFVDLRTRHDLPIREGFGAVNFEVGTSVFAISGSVGGDYLHNDKVSSLISESFENNEKKYALNNKSRKLGYDGQLLFKWIPRPNNYFAGVAKGRMAHSRINADGKGLYDNYGYSAILHNRIDEGGWLGAAFYEHTMRDTSTLSVFAKYNRGVSDIDDTRSDSTVMDANESVQEYWESEKSHRDQYTVTIDYNGTDHAFGNISGGNNFEYTIDSNLDQTVNPNDKTKIRLASNYTYVSYMNMWNRLFVMGSLGIQYMHIRTDVASNHWWRPRAVATVGVRLPKAQNIRLIYNLDNELPRSSQLSTFNNSTNPWLRIEGNPYLVPMEKHRVALIYDKSFSKFSGRLYAQYDYNHNMIEQYVRDEDEYSIQSYRNYGSLQNFKTGGIFTFSSSKFRATLKAAYLQEKYNSSRSHGMVELGGNIRWDFSNFFIYADVSWQNRSFTAISRTQYKNPTLAHVQIAWQATKNLYFSLGLPYFWGTREEKTKIKQGDYAMTKRTRFESASLRPWILISWTLRKNSKQSIQDKMTNY